VTFESEVHVGFFCRNMKERKRFKNLRLEGRLISNFSQLGWECMDWISLAGFSKQDNEFSGDVKLH